MSLLNENISVKIKEVKHMMLGNSSIKVAPRPYHALALRLKGAVSFNFGDEKLSSHENEVFFMPANRGYVADYDGENEIIVIHFESAATLSPQNFETSENDKFTSLFYKMLSVWQKRDTGYYFSTLSLMGELLSEMARAEALPLSHATKAAFESAIELMEKSYTDQSFSVNIMVERAHMSNTYFRRLFVARFGTTPIKHLMATRLSHAEKLLSSGKYTVTEAAEASGFSDIKYFSRLINREYGVPPSLLYKKIK